MLVFRHFSLCSVAIESLKRLKVPTVNKTLHNDVEVMVVHRGPTDPQSERPHGQRPYKRMLDNTVRPDHRKRKAVNGTNEKNSLTTGRDSFLSDQKGRGLDGCTSTANICYRDPD